MNAVSFRILWKHASAQQINVRLPGHLVVSLYFTGDVRIPVTPSPSSLGLDSLFHCFLMLNKAAFVLCDDSIYCVCSWTLHMLCDLCLSDSLYFFVKYFNKIIFTT